MAGPTDPNDPTGSKKHWRDRNEAEALAWRRAHRVPPEQRLLQPGESMIVFGGPWNVRHSTPPAPSGTPEVWPAPAGVRDLWPEREATAADVAPLLRATTVVHDEALAQSGGQRNACVFASAALTDVLVALGYAAQMVRVEVSFFGGARSRGVATWLGSFGDGSRQPAAAKGQWHGHVGVLVEAGPAGPLSEAVYLDPTIDQAEGLVLAPIAVRVPADWWRVGGRARLRWEDGTFAWLKAHPEREGWRGAPDYRAKGRRLPLVARCLTTLTVGQPGA